MDCIKLSLDLSKRSLRRLDIDLKRTQRILRICRICLRRCQIIRILVLLLLNTTSLILKLDQLPLILLDLPIQVLNRCLGLRDIRLENIDSGGDRRDIARC